MRGVARGIRHNNGSHKPLARWHLANACDPLVPEIEKICTADSVPGCMAARVQPLDVLWHRGDFWSSNTAVDII